MEDPQAVNGTPEAEPQQVSADETVAQEPDLDSILAEYDQPAEPEQKPEEAPQVAKPSSDVEAFVARQIKKENDQAFLDRENNPGKWNEVLRGISNELKQDMVKIDAPSTESWNAVEASVHSSSTTTPKPDSEFDPKAVRKLSDADFSELQKKLGFKR